MANRMELGAAMGKARDRPNKGREGPAPGPVLDLERYVPGLLTFVANKLSRSASAVYGREFGVNVTEWRILSQLAIEPGIPASRICQVIGFDKGPVSRTLAGLERAGLVRLDADRADARRSSITLTEAGQALHDRIIPVALDRERRLLGCLSREEQAELIGYLNRLHGNLDAVSAAAPEGQARPHGNRSDPAFSPDDAHPLPAPAGSGSA